MLDVHDDVILVVRRNAINPDKLSIANLPAKGQENSIVWKDLTQSQYIESLQNCTYQYMELMQDSNDEVSKYRLQYVRNKIFSPML